MAELTIDSQVSGLAVALAEANDLRIGPSCGELRSYCAEAAERVRRAGLPGGDQRRAAVRELLRSGGFKPAQEYLLRAVLEQGGLPHIFNAVDLINAVSLHVSMRPRRLLV